MARKKLPRVHSKAQLGYLEANKVPGRQAMIHRSGMGGYNSKAKSRAAYAALPQRARKGR